MVSVVPVASWQVMLCGTPPRELLYIAVFVLGPDQLLQ